MGTRLEGKSRSERKFRRIAPAALALALIACATDPQTRAQSAAGNAPTAQAPTPQWQIDAGGKMEFDIASVKPDTAAQSATTTHSNIPLGPQDAFSPTGGLLSSTNWPLSQYMVFAYKLTAAQFRAVQAALPKWANSDRYDIQARASGNPTKDQFRLMMQALLADRFKLAIHYETKQLPVMALELDKPGKLGPKIQLHPSDVPCSTAPLPPGSAPGAIPTVAGGFPEPCGELIGWPSENPPGRILVGARNVPLTMFSTLIDNPATGIDRPVLDKTGLEGKYDFIFEFTPQFNGPLPPGANFTPDPTGPTFQEALKEQLGFRLVPQTGPVDVIVIDHVEEPSAN
jgi:uncharacterized protein (TIGR03435 family)